MVNIAKVAKALGTSHGPSLMLAENGNITEYHSHMMGVLVLLGNGQKQWKLKPPGKEEEIVMTQSVGEIFWLPPGYNHEVTSLGLERTMCGKAVVTAWSHCCLPQHLAAEALCSFACSITSEKELATPPKRTNLRQIWTAIFIDK